MQKELTSQEQAKIFYTQLVEDCKKAFLNAGIELYRPVITIGSSSLEISVAPENPKSEFETLFASDITFYSSPFYEREPEINFGSSGSFTPENKASYWRTIHAANILKNWEKACEIFKMYCKKHKEFYSVL